MKDHNAPRTLLDKLWDAHVVVKGEAGTDLLYIDRHLLHEGSFHAFAQLERQGHRVRRPDLTFAFADHYVPTAGADPAGSDPDVRRIVRDLGHNTHAAGIRAFGSSHPERGIVHVAAPELGLTWPGHTVVCGDSHTTTHGALGALAFGIGASEVRHVLATQTLWQRRPRTMAVRIHGRLGFGVGAKDLALHVIATLGAGGGTGHAIQFLGPTVEHLSMEGRMTLCNLAVEAQGRAGMVEPDETTFSWLRGRAHAPQGSAWEQSLERWGGLRTDPGAVFDQRIEIDASQVAPLVTWGTSPEDAAPITDRVPDPHRMGARGEHVSRALRYMGLTPGTPLEQVPIDRVFIGSCTNARLGDLKAAAEVLRGRRACVPAWVVPGSRTVKRQAEAEGLDRVFRDAGFEWRDAGCSMCLGLNGDLLEPGERCVSTTNRNFEGRQGRGGRTHLVGPAMAAAAAVTGRLTDVRKLAASGAT